MDLTLERQKKLAYVAKRYYLEDQKQSDIAQELGVSRPLVSRMLSEAREQGIVEITIHEPGAREARLLERLRLSHLARNTYEMLAAAASRNLTLTCCSSSPSRKLPSHSYIMSL